jgi:hypothetical protein
MSTASGYFSRYDLAISREKAVLKCLDGPAHIVRPGVRPPSSLPDRAMLIAGTVVGTMSFLVKNLDSDRMAVSLIVEFFLSLSKSDI